MFGLQTGSDNKISIRAPALDRSSINLFGCEHQRKDTDYLFHGVDIRCALIRFSSSSITKAAPNFKAVNTQLGEEHTLNGDKIPELGGSTDP